MQFYFAWADKDAAFDPDIHLREDEKIVSLHISHNEGEFPSARITLCHGFNFDRAQDKAFISCVHDGKVTLLFSGFLLSVPDNILDQTLELDLIAEPQDSHEILQKTQESLKVLPNYDPLFCQFSESNQTEEVLDGYTILPHWSRTLEGFSFSDIFQGTKEKDIGNRFIRDSLKLKLKTPPIDSIACDLSAEWEQRYDGTVNAGFGIKSHLPEGQIITLTPNKLQQNWWTPSTVIPGNTYQIISSGLRNCQVVGESASYKVYGKETPYTLPVYAMEPELTLTYKIKQKRKETVRFELKNNCQKLFKSRRVHHHKQLTFNLEDITYDHKKIFWQAETDYKKDQTVYYKGNYYICLKDHRSGNCFVPIYWEISFDSDAALGDLSSSSFFITDRGQHSINSAIERCKAYLAASARAVEINLRIPFLDGLDLDCDTSISIKDPRLPKEEATGKVVRYTMCAKGNDQAYVDITLLCSVGEDSFKDSATDFKTPSGIGYNDYKDQQPNKGIPEPKSLGGIDIVQDVSVSNSAEMQNELIDGKQFIKTEIVTKCLQKNPTSLEMRLADLNTPGMLCHQIDLVLPNAWTPPCHIKF